MPLDPQVQAAMDRVAATGVPPVYMLKPEVARQAYRERCSWTALKCEGLASIANRAIPGPAGETTIRVYTPAGSGPFPVLVFFHGGGWLQGDLDTHDSICRYLAKGADCLVVAVDYRLSPENHFPAAIEDCYAATQWVAAHAAELNGDPSRIAVGGDSAGGNLSAVVAIMARDRGEPRLAFQLLIYPNTDCIPSTESFRENAEGYMLTATGMKYFYDNYFASDADRVSPLASPLREADLSDLPAALVITAEFDPLRDEGEQYARRMQQAGVPVTHTRYDGLIHGFILMDALIDRTKDAIQQCTDSLRAAFSKSKQ